MTAKSSSRRDFLRKTAYTAVVGGLSAGNPEGMRTALAASERDGGKRRNVILILIDDHRYDAMSFLGHPFVETPNLDAMAAGGVYFPNAFVTTSLCSPSRASILTGRYMHNHNVVDNGTRLMPGNAIFPQQLQANGYETAFIGKWHMGGGTDEPSRAGILPARQRPDAERQRQSRAANRIHHRRTDRLRDRLAWQAKRRQAFLHVPFAQGRPRTVRRAGPARGQIQGRQSQPARIYGRHGRELSRQANVGQESAQSRTIAANQCG